MIILDLNQVLIASFAAQYNNELSETGVEEGLLRHMILNTIRYNNNKYRDEYGELVIACDDRNYWRKNIFPYYKAKRRIAQEESGIDWKNVFESLWKVRDELKEFFPYRVIHVATAEADDIISTLVTNFGETMAFGNNKILILSGDHDFIQLQNYGNVSQYDPIRRISVSHPNPALYLKEQIIRGDAGDGVPNFLSDDDTFVTTGKRQKPIRADKLEGYINTDPKQFLTEQLVRNYERNKALIDLTQIPENIRSQVMEQFNSQAGKTKQHLMNYFIKNRLKNLMESIQDF